MKFRVLIGSLLLVIFLADYSMGQIDPDPNGIGVYFDEGATVVSISADPASSVNAYLILTNPTEIGGIAYWEAYVDHQLPGTFSNYSSVYGEPRFGINYWDPMSGASFIVFNVVIDTPQPLERVTILADLIIWLNGEVNPVGLYVCDTFYSKVGYGGPYVLCNPSSGNSELPVASINGPAPVVVEKRSWGQVKALFRN